MNHNPVDLIAVQFSMPLPLHIHAFVGQEALSVAAAIAVGATAALLVFERPCAVSGNALSGESTFF